MKRMLYGSLHSNVIFLVVIVNTLRVNNNNNKKGKYDNHTR